MAENISPRVNSARLANFVGKPIRLPCKVLSVSGPNIIVEASDGGNVTIVPVAGADSPECTYCEIIGTVSDPTTIKMMACINLGNNLDLKLTNDTIEMMFDSRFERMFGLSS
ncbi:hypothetical protein AGABI1DRAFT_115241 [Agaricus bisporus var. burnettii JB137-S8]|uniref:Replication factor A protein 3 n=1 Tax=Agaricus bisporus var. burnettii (strain JB137-S8 / ATCC MYA-4627 / FGSC 10392) TaxID=597362 RepID=K5VS66_AGABU|nr:hypothetical protein AGABI2DRAFT_194202 [Agaricus bisporus var. bisporus H97]XP_007331966.1 uncharacterized protein AGABI1DRAFT_115241 [Agaricus bisporus var. burnettii JB137-S8]EKM77309.1 hypothetical protein AGABI1DRAFT_115241 [Agaricus bisporus var. burnettii JB137-S8]EKV45217.1 hypothetical protein AGABI2DRAFT_194202 [Agaricus bisporus var. bisporus H97]